MGKNLVVLAEDYCKHYHGGQRRKGGNQEPYDTHPFAVRSILVDSGYDDEETQATSLLHDTIEDTELVKKKKEIEKIFGTVIYSNVYVLSKNATGKNAEDLVPLFRQLGVEYVDKNGILTPNAYKLRILMHRDTVKRVKIADMIHNTECLPDLSNQGIERKIVDAEEFYIPLGKIVAPIMVKGLILNIDNYKKSDHYKSIFVPK